MSQSARLLAWNEAPFPSCVHVCCAVLTEVFTSSSTHGVSIDTTVQSTYFRLSPRLVETPNPTCYNGMAGSPCLITVFSQAGRGLVFIRKVENKMRSFRLEL